MFDSDYEVYLADTAESRSLHHKVRYQVFCLERGFERPDEFRNHEERDHWDRHSHQFVVQSRASSAAVAAVRLIMPTAEQLPVEHMECITEQLPVPAKRSQIAEVSRICVVRGGNPDANSDLPFPTSWQLPVEPVSPTRESEILLGMIRAILRYSMDQKIPFLYMLVTRPFARLLKRLGVHCTQVGEGIEHRGMRAPYFIDVDRSWEGLVSRSGEVAQLFSREHLSYFSHAETRPKRVMNYVNAALREKSLGMIA
jgi:N-acyl amino acid synthase of PEP-CTERM/exosortase system